MKYKIFLLNLILATSFIKSTPLHEAIDQGNITNFIKAIQNKDIINIKHKGKTALHRLIEQENTFNNSYLEINWLQKSKLFLNGIDITYNNRIPTLECIKLLLLNGADLNIQDDSGQTPLHLAVKTRNMPSSVSILLLEHGADPNIQDNIGQTPLHITRSSSTLRSLLKYKSNPNIQDNNQKTPGHKAMFNGAIDKLHALNIIDRETQDACYEMKPSPWKDPFDIEKSPNISLKDSKGQTYLHIAIKKYIVGDAFEKRKYECFIKFIIKSNLNVTIYDDQLRTLINNLPFRLPKNYPYFISTEWQNRIETLYNRIQGISHDSDNTKEYIVSELNAIKQAIENKEDGSIYLLEHYKMLRNKIILISILANNWSNQSGNLFSLKYWFPEPEKEHYILPELANNIVGFLKNSEIKSIVNKF